MYHMLYYIYYMMFVLLMHTYTRLPAWLPWLPGWRAVELYDLSLSLYIYIYAHVYTYTYMFARSGSRLFV